MRDSARTKVLEVLLDLPRLNIVIKAGAFIVTFRLETWRDQIRLLSRAVIIRLGEKRRKRMKASLYAQTCNP